MNRLNTFVRVGLQQNLLSSSRSTTSLQTTLDTVAMRRLCNGSVGARYFASNKGGNSASSGKSEAKPSKEVVQVSNIENWKKELATLSAKEIQTIKENHDSQFLNQPNEIQDFLSRSGYVLKEEADESVLLTRTTKGFTVKIRFHVHPEDDEESGLENNSLEDMEDQQDRAIAKSEIRDSRRNNISDSEAEENEAAEAVEGASGEEDGESVPTKNVAFEAEVIFNDKNGEPKGKICYVGEVAADSRVYINELQAHTDASVVVSGPDAAKDKSFPTAVFDRLNQDLQDRMYDLLDETGIDDKLGGFIRYYVDSYEDKQTMQVLENIKKIFS